MNAHIQLTTRAPAPRSIRSPFLIAIALLLLPNGLQAQEPSIREGVAYRAGQTVQADAAGVRFVIPQGSSGQLDTETGLFVVLGGEIRAAVWAFSDGTTEDVAAVMAGDLEELGLVLSEDEIVAASEARIEGYFDVMEDWSRARLFGVVIRGREGNVFGVAALGAPGSDAALERVASDIASSVEWSTPGAHAWATEVAGSALHSGEETSTISFSPGNESASHAALATVEITLCSDASYHYVSDDQAFFSTEDVTVSSEGGSEHEGTWSLVADIRGVAWLVLESWTGEERVYEVEMAGEGVLLGGVPYSVDSSGC